MADKKDTMTIRFDKPDLEGLHKFAAEQYVATTRMVRRWILERWEEEKKKMASK